MPTVLQSVRNFLTAQKAKHNDPGLLDRYLSADDALEIQINVAADGGEPVEGRRNTYTDGVETWWNIRCPKKANSEPEWSDYKLHWDLSAHVDAIGCTGWDFQNRVSKYVGFDFDSITGHAAGVGISPEQLDEVRKLASALPYVEVRKSTGGKGLHLYVLLDSIPTANHTEHAALGRAVLAKMATEAGFDFTQNVDACGTVLWVWHRKTNKENGGFSLIKSATCSLTEADLAGWRDHVDVVTRKRRKVRMPGVPDELQDGADAIASSRQRIPLDTKHRAVIFALREAGYLADLVADHHCLHTTTLGLAKLNDEHREKLGLLGYFKTLSSGSTPINCFCFPLVNGAWKVYRFGTGVGEAETWERNEQWTSCYFNQKPSLEIASLAFDGVELEANKGWQFSTAVKAKEAMAALGEKIDLPEQLNSRQTTLSRNRDGRLVAKISCVEGDPPLTGWLLGKKNWIRVFNCKTEIEEKERQIEIVRCIVSPDKEIAGFSVLSESEYYGAAMAAATARLRGEGYTKDEAAVLVGEAIAHPWLKVSLPFQPEYPGGRQWNKNAAQFKVQPSLHRDGSHTHWDLILNHCGDSLTEALSKLEWARAANILTGGDYLRSYLAALIQQPFEQLPYLFLWGPENCGKSIFWESQCELYSGVVRADRILSGTDNFCGELDGAVLCVVDERDVGKTPGALNKIKDFVTSKTISIRKPYSGAYQTPNTTHWVQFANKPEFCPIFPGDTRITVIEVCELKTEIPKHTLLEKLREEAPAFLRTLLDTTLPPVTGRLRLPVVETDSKTEQATTNAPLLAFIKDCIDNDPKSDAVKSDVFARYQTWRSENDAGVMEVDEFYRGMQKAMPSARTKRITTGDGIRRYAYHGIALRP